MREANLLTWTAPVGLNAKILQSPQSRSDLAAMLAVSILWSCSCKLDPGWQDVMSRPTGTLALFSVSLSSSKHTKSRSVFYSCLSQVSCKGHLKASHPKIQLSCLSSCCLSFPALLWLSWQPQLVLPSRGLSPAGKPAALWYQCLFDPTHPCVAWTFVSLLANQINRAIKQTFDFNCQDLVRSTAGTCQ